MSGTDISAERPVGADVQGTRDSKGVTAGRGEQVAGEQDRRVWTTGDNKGTRGGWDRRTCHKGNKTTMDKERQKLSKTTLCSSVAVRTCSPRTWEAEAGGLKVQGQPELSRETPGATKHECQLKECLGRQA